MTDHEFIEKLLDVPEENQTIELKRIGSKGDIEKIIETMGWSRASNQNRAA